MRCIQRVKRLSIRLGIYKPTRWLLRQVRPDELRHHLDNVELYRSLIPRDALCFDVGANTGWKSEALLAVGVRVIAFEPNPMVIPELMARCSRHGRWTLVQAALGSGVSIATLYARQEDGQSGLDRDWEGEIVASFHVPVITLDSAIQAFGRPAFCKIDVEGWELEVLKGLTSVIPLISFEFHLSQQNIAQTISCLQRIASSGASHVNLTINEGTAFRFRQWMPIREFLEWFPGDLVSLPESHYGDIFIKSDAA